MAKADAVGINFVVQDAKGATSNFTIHVPWMTNDVANSYEALGDEFADEIEKMIDGELISATLSVPISFDFTPTAAVAGCDIEEKGRLVFRTTDGTLSEFNIPTIKNDIIVPGSDVIDPLHTDVAGFMDLLANGADADPGVGVNLKKIMDYRGAIISTVVEFVEAFVRSRRA